MFYFDTKSLRKSIWYFLCLSSPLPTIKRNDENFNCYSLSGPSSLYRWGKLLKLGVGSCVCWDCTRLASALYVPDMHRWGAISLGKCLRGNPQHKWGAAEAERRRKKNLKYVIFNFKLKWKPLLPLLLKQKKKRRENRKTNVWDFVIGRIPVATRSCY